MKLISFLVFAALSPVLWATVQAAPPRLIVRGDDMGFSHSGNEAILECYKNGIESSVEVLVPSPWFPEAVKLLTDNPQVDVGIHLALSSEWDNIKWRPLTKAPSLCDADGYFFPMIYRNKNYPQQALAQHNFQLAEIEQEFRAQIELALKKIPRISHVSSHMGCAELRDDVKALTKKLAQEYKIDISPSELGVQNIGYKGAHGTAQEKLDSFLNMLDSLEPDKTYLFVDHPGLDGPELRAVQHIGYENVAQDRQGVTTTWTSPRVREHLRARGIQLIGYRDLKK